MESLKDIIDVPDVKTVIQLSDIYDQDLKIKLAEDFILTSEVYSNLKVIVEMIENAKGAGVFLEGNFGSGKSHFLTIISLLFNNREAWQPLLTQEPDLVRIYEILSSKNYLTVDVSLVEHSSRTHLEDIISKSIIEAYHREYNHPLFDEGEALPDRKEFYGRLEEKLHVNRTSGLILLIDELSEFLRSKPESRSFNEDIRFLQYLGEKAPSYPIWIVATLQESIEDTGQTTQEAFNKIKDRYPFRLFLTGTHIEQLIAKRLIKIKPDQLERVSELYSALKTYFPHLPIGEEQFLSLYPVHPATISFLDNLKPLFSQHRGVVDFIHYQLKGDSGRNIAGMLHLPCDHLLTPERIFDHFRVRIKERVELNPFNEVVYKYYEDEMGNIFDNETDLNLAFRILKVLILIAISPVKKKRTVKDIAEMLLYRITELESSINYQYIRDILERLYQEGAYISMDKGKKPLEDHFYINLEADISLLVKRSAEYLVGSFFEDDVRLFTRLKELLDDPRLPLKEYSVSEKTMVKFLWQSTPREGIFLLDQVDGLTHKRLDEIMLELQETEADFAVIAGTTHRLAKQRSHLEEVILPHLKEKNAFFILFWLPQVPEVDVLKETLALLLLLEKYKEDFTERGGEIKNFIEGLLSNEKRLIKEKFLEAYHNGTLFSILSGEENIQESLKFKILQDLLSYLGEGMLEARYPGHTDISPYTSFATRDQLQEVVEDLLKKGDIVIKKGSRHSLKRIVEGFLLPMKVAKSTSNGFKMVVDPSKNILVERFMELVSRTSGDGRPSLEDIYRKLRKGDLGLSRIQFELLCLALIFTGHIIPYSRGRRKPPDEISIYNLKKIDEVSKGEILSREFQKELASLPFIPKRHKNRELNFLTQKELWEELAEIKVDKIREIQNLEEKINRASEYKALRSFDLAEFRKNLEDLRRLFDEVKTSYPPREGMERFLSESRNHPFIKKSFSRFEAAKGFFMEDLERYLFIYGYINHPDLLIPEGKEYETINLQLTDIKGHLKSNAPYLEEGYMENLGRLFNTFLQGYVLQYQKEHQRTTSPEVLHTYTRVKDSLRHKILSGFSMIEYISVRNDRVKVERMLAEVSSTRCSGLSMEILHRKPICECNFNLGDRSELPGIHSVESIIDQGIIEYLSALKEGKNRERIISYTAGLKEVGKTRTADKINRLLDFDISRLSNKPGDSLKELGNILDSKVIKAINDAFSGKVIVVPRDIDEFYENTVERSFPKDRLLDIFREWLQGGETLKEETYVKVVSSKRGALRPQAHPTSYHTLSEIVRERYPELTGLYKGLGERELNLVLFLSLWGKNHEIEEKRLLPFIGKILKREAGNMGEIRKEISSNYELLSRAAEYVMANKEEDADNLIEDAESLLKEKGVDKALFDFIGKRVSSLDYLNIIEREEVFSYPMMQAFEHLIKRVEGDPSKIQKKVIEETLSRQRETGGSKRLKKESLFQTLRHLISMETSLMNLPNMLREDGDFLFWEDSYLSSLWGVFYDYHYTYHSLNQLGLLDEINLYKKKKTLEDISMRWGKVFGDFWLQRGEDIEKKERKRGKRPLCMMDIPDTLFKRFKGALGKDKGYFILLDGMRWDLWEYIKENTFITKSLNYRILEEIPLWALLPTTTEVQIGSLLASTEKYDMVAEGKTSYANIRESGASLADAYDEIELENDIKIVKFGFIDNKVHQSRDDLITLFREISLNIEVSVKSYMDRIPKGSLIFLFSDHGFVENLKFKGGKDEPRYLHGGATPWEVIVPMVVILKI